MSRILPRARDPDPGQAGRPAHPESAPPEPDRRRLRRATHRRVSRRPFCRPARGAGLVQHPRAGGHVARVSKALAPARVPAPPKASIRRRLCHPTLPRHHLTPSRPTTSASPRRARSGSGERSAVDSAGSARADRSAWPARHERRRNIPTPAASRARACAKRGHASFRLAGFDRQRMLNLRSHHSQTRMIRT